MLSCQLAAVSALPWIVLDLCERCLVLACTSSSSYCCKSVLCMLLCCCCRCWYCRSCRVVVVGDGVSCVFFCGCRFVVVTVQQLRCYEVRLMSLRPPESACCSTSSSPRSQFAWRSFSMSCDCPPRPTISCNSPCHVVVQVSGLRWSPVGLLSPGPIKFLNPVYFRDLGCTGLLALPEFTGHSVAFGLCEEHPGGPL